jgi:hypothetical protein
MEEKRIYVVVAATVQTVRGIIVQPPGRQFAQGCHVVSKLRFEDYKKHASPPNNGVFESITTITLQARDSAELRHIAYLLDEKNITPILFYDTNDAYGPGEILTAVAAFMTPMGSVGITDYLPMWGKQ